MTWSHDWYADAVTLGNNLADYIDWGGKVVNLRESLGDSSPDESNLFVPAGRFPSYTGNVGSREYLRGHEMLQ